MKCQWCGDSFTRKSNLKRHILNKHDNKSVHHHGLQYVNKMYITRETRCFLHDGEIKDGMMFHCFACNYSICGDCLSEDCKYCTKDLCSHKNIFIVIK